MTWSPKALRRGSGAGPGLSERASARAANAFLRLLADVKREVDARLVALFEARVPLARSHGPEVSEMVTAVRDLCLRGGKRLRAGLVVAGFRAAGGRGSLAAPLEAGVALELLQAYLLIHDDWMDGDRTRRGGPAVHAHLGERFGSTELGDASGILAGDYAAALALEVLSAIRAERARARVLASFAEMQLDAIAGQELDLLGRTADVELVYRLKTASYTVHGPLRIGALLGGGTQRTLKVLERFSLPIGVAFQMRDDLLNAYGDPRTTGKPRGSDLRSGKRTLLLLRALERTRGRERRTLTRVAGNAHASQVELTRALAVIDACGARAHVEARIEECVQQALSALKSGLSAQGAELLRGAAQALTARLG